MNRCIRRWIHHIFLDAHKDDEERLRQPQWIAHTAMMPFRVNYAFSPPYCFQSIHPAVRSEKKKSDGHNEKIVWRSSESEELEEKQPYLFNELKQRVDCVVVVNMSGLLLRSCWLSTRPFSPLYKLAPFCRSLVSQVRRLFSRPDGACWALALATFAPTARVVNPSVRPQSRLHALAFAVRIKSNIKRRKRRGS